MNWKSKQRIIAINLLMFALLFVLVSLNKEYLRPLFGHMPFVGILTGSLPNFLAAFMISLAFVNAVTARELKYRRHIVYIGSALVFVILAVEELKPMWGASTHYDSYDILASGLGSLSAMLTFELVEFFRNRRRKER